MLVSTPNQKHNFLLHRSAHLWPLFSSAAVGENCPWPSISRVQEDRRVSFSRKVSRSGFYVCGFLSRLLFSNCASHTRPILVQIRRALQQPPSCRVALQISVSCASDHLPTGYRSTQPQRKGSMFAAALTTAKELPLAF